MYPSNTTLGTQSQPTCVGAVAPGLWLPGQGSRTGPLCCREAVCSPTPSSLTQRPGPAYRPEAAATLPTCRRVRSGQSRSEGYFQAGQPWVVPIMGYSTRTGAYPEIWATAFVCCLSAWLVIWNKAIKRQILQLFKKILNFLSENLILESTKRTARLPSRYLLS